MKLYILLTQVIGFFGLTSVGSSTEAVHELQQSSQSLSERNKKFVLEFYQKVINEQNLSILDDYIVDDYIQHNPLATDGKEGLRAGLAFVIAGGTPKHGWELKRVIADGDTVWLHSARNIFGKNMAVVDIFRLDNGLGKIVEHWDVIQEIKPSEINKHPYF